LKPLVPPRKEKREGEEEKERNKRKEGGKHMFAWLVVSIMVDLILSNFFTKDFGVH
jgi:hypothetical protein